MNAKQINPLLESTASVLTTMAMVTITAGTPAVKKNTRSLGDVTGMIKLTGKDCNGSLSISFSSAAILRITENMLGEKLSAIDDTVIDVVGEITNMITGSAKRIYSEQGMEFELTRPAMLVGHEQLIEHGVAGATMVLPFTIDAGEFFVEACFS